MLAEVKLLQDCRSRGFESHYIRPSVNIRYIDLISKVFQKFGFHVRPSVSFALRVIQIFFHFLHSITDCYLLVALSSRNFSTFTKAWLFFFILGATEFLLFTAGSSSVNSVSCKQVVDIHKPSAYRFRLLVVPLQTNF